MTRIDAHQHYWAPERGDYDWIPRDEPVLWRRYTPDDLEPHLAAQGIAATVLVQAAPTVEETEYMLGLADASRSVAGVVGWIDFEDPDHRRHLERFAAHPKFRGVRPMIQDIADPEWCLRADLRWAFDALTELDLTFDALGLSRHLAPFRRLFDRHPDLRVVIDHAMKPPIREGLAGFHDWAAGMTRLAETGAACKLSGLVTEAGPGWRVEDLHPWAGHVLEVFGPERVMWGSDWPVCRLAADYDAWLRAAEALTAGLTGPERAEVFGGTAMRVYGLDL